jgi:uncharacterized YigZ family protein
LNQTLYTVSKLGEGTYKDKGSKFIAYIFPLSTEEEIKDRLAELRAEHKKARHVCYAFRIGYEGELERQNYDGEPSGSAGLPILNQIHSAGLSNVGLFVVRYFGGTKLGMAGLIKAYKEASKLAISDSDKRPLIPKTLVKVNFPISSVGDVERIIYATDSNLKKSDFNNMCTFYIEVNDSSVHKLLTMLDSVESAKTSIE